MEKIVITGLGTVNSIGLSVAETWKNVTRGVSGVGKITLFDTTGWNVEIACELKGNPHKHVEGAL